MGLFIRQDEQRSQLQERLASEMAERARAKLEKSPDGVDDSQYIKGTKTTSSLAWVWLIIAAIVIGLAVYAIVLVS